MPVLTFGKSDFQNVVTHGDANAPVAYKTVQLSGRQKKLRITGAASMLSGINDARINPTSLPFNVKYGDAGSAEKYYLDTRCKDTFDKTIPFRDKNQLVFMVVWKGECVLNEGGTFDFELDFLMEISIHEIMEGDE